MPAPLAGDITRFPQDDDELWEFVATFLGIRIPRTACCRTHVAPFTAFADAFFARHPVAIWKASRGFGGKSFLLAALAYVEMIALGAGVSVLGGSAAQSQNVVRYMLTFWRHPLAPRRWHDHTTNTSAEIINGEPGQFETWLTNGAYTRALKASQTSVRGPHPHRLRMDEIDEMDLALLDSAFGQPMEGVAKIPTQIVLSSTHQYPDGTMTEALKRAKVKGWPVFEWCWRENVEPHGWLAQAEVSRTRHDTTEVRWQTEYELQEPAATGRAITPEAVERMFDPALGVSDGPLGQDMEFEKPEPWGIYVTGADWGKKLHFSAIITFRLDCTPCRVVAVWRDQRKPYSIMAPVLNRRLQRFPGKGVHDSAGVGEAVGEHLTLPVEGYDQWQGKQRQALFNEYVTAVEQGKLLAPRIEPWYLAHKFLTTDDLFGSGHPPDEVAACALAWHGRPPYLGASASDVPVLAGGRRSDPGAFQPEPHPHEKVAPILPGAATGRRGLII